MWVLTPQGPGLTPESTRFADDVTHLLGLGGHVQCLWGSCYKLPRAHRSAGLVVQSHGPTYRADSPAQASLCLQPGNSEDKHRQEPSNETSGAVPKI